MNDDAILKELMEFLDSSPTASRAVSGLSGLLENGGFTRIREEDHWSMDPGEKFYAVRSSSSIIAGIAGEEPCESTGFRIVGAHTDFPGFRIKPCPDRKSDGISVIGVEVYGGPIMATWFDRDLSVAGTLAVSLGDRISRAPFVLREPLLRMASPAIHIERDVNREGFKVDAESGTPLLFSTSGASFRDILGLACTQASVDPDNVAGWSMEVWDPQPAVLGGINGEFLFSGRIDNLAMCHAAVRALLEAGAGPSTSLVTLFNSEEVGSRSLNGAGSLFLDTVMERIAGDRERYFRSIPRSIQVSADGAHGLHPNYTGKHDPGCRPLLNGGPVIKVNAMEKYTSSDITSAYFATCAGRCGVEVQYFVSRNDMPCGSTIGPVTSSRTGILSVDAGNPMLSMHSVREMAGSGDHGDMVRVLTEHFRGNVTLND